MGKSTCSDYPLPSTPQIITAIANNEWNLQPAISSLAIAIENAGLDDIRVIADEFQTASPVLQPQYYVPRTQAPQRSKT